MRVILFGIVGILLVGCTPASTTHDAAVESERLSWVGSATLEGVDGTEAHGFAELEIRDNAVLFPRIRITLPSPTNGETYEAWLFRENLSGTSISIGPLIEQDGTFYLVDAQMRVQEDLRPYVTVAITREPTDDNNPAPSSVVAKGQLMQTGGMGLRAVEFP